MTDETENATQQTAANIEDALDQQDARYGRIIRGLVVLVWILVALSVAEAVWLWLVIR